MSALSDAKILLRIADTSQDELLSTIERLVIQKLQNICSLDVLPTNMDNIVTICIIATYRKIGSEHVQQETQGDYQGVYVEIPPDVLMQLPYFRRAKLV